MFTLSGSGATMGPASGSFDPLLPPLDEDEPPAPLPLAVLPPVFPAPPFAPLPPFPTSPPLPPLLLVLAPLAAFPPFCAPPDARPTLPPSPASPWMWLESDESHATRMPALASTSAIREKSLIIIGFEFDKRFRLHDRRAPHQRTVPLRNEVSDLTRKRGHCCPLSWPRRCHCVWLGVRNGRYR